MSFWEFYNKYWYGLRFDIICKLSNSIWLVFDVKFWDILVCVLYIIDNSYICFLDISMVRGLKLVWVKD